MNVVKKTLANIVIKAIARKFETSPSTTAGLAAVVAAIGSPSPTGMVTQTGNETIDWIIRGLVFLSGIWFTFTSAKEGSRNVE